jgi:hypothetical protein
VSIDGVIVGVHEHHDGRVSITLEPRSARDSSSGQTRMWVLNPPLEFKDLECLLGAEVWGDSTSLMCGRERKLADRSHYTELRLVEDYDDVVLSWRASRLGSKNPGAS